MKLYNVVIITMNNLTEGTVINNYNNNKIASVLLNSEVIAVIMHFP